MMHDFPRYDTNNAQRFKCAIEMKDFFSATSKTAKKVEISDILSSQSLLNKRRRFMIQKLLVMHLNLLTIQ